MSDYTFQASDLGMLISVALAFLAIRLFRTARATRKAPELLAGLYLVTVPPAVSLGIRLDRLGPAHHHALEILVYLGLVLGGVALALFTWQSFRPRTAWARWLALGLTLVLAVGFVLDVAQGQSTAGSRGVALRLAGWVASIWLCVESVHHYLLMRRRRRLGLVDPVVANRFLLFSIWTGPFVLLPLLTIAWVVVNGRSIELETSGLYRVVVRLNGLVMFAGMWLSFYPPRSYQRWIRSRHAAASSAAA